MAVHGPGQELDTLAATGHCPEHLQVNTHLDTLVDQYSLL